MDKFTKFIRKISQEYDLGQYQTKQYLDYFLVVFSLLLGFYLKWDILNVIIFSFIIWIILNPISSRILARMSLCGLVFVPLLLIFHRDDIAEQFAVFSYYFLVLTLIAMIIEFKKKQANKTHSRGK